MSAIHLTRHRLTAFAVALAFAATSGVAVADEPLPDGGTVVVEEQQLLDVDASTGEVTPSVNEVMEQADEESAQTNTNEAIPVVEPTQAADEDVADTEGDDTNNVEEPDSELELAATNVVPDVNFRACVNKQLGYEKEQARAVTAAQMKQLEYLVCQDSKPAASFEGIQYATNVEGVMLSLAKNADLSALTKMSSAKISGLTLANYGAKNNGQKARENITLDAVPDLSKLPILSMIRLYGVSFKKYDNLAKCRKLTELFISNTSLKDISWVSKLTNLKTLWLQENLITDMTPVTTLKKLDSLNLEANRITALPRPKVSMSNLSYFSISRNQIRDLRNLSAWKTSHISQWNDFYIGQQQLFRIKPVFKGGNTEIDISSFYGIGGARPTKAYLAEKETTGYSSSNRGYYRALSARAGSIVNGGKTARFTGKLAEGQLVWIENETVGSYVVRVGDSKVRKITVSVSGGSTLPVGAIRTVKATVTPADSLNTKVTWSSSNPKVATVDANGKLTGKKLGSATITATAADGSGVKASVKITVVEKQCSLRPGPASFRDVSASHPFAKDISWLSQKGITTGWPDNTFGPQLSVHRDAFAAFLYRMACEPSFTPPKVSPFKDVPTTHPFYREITWAASKGITKGWSDGTFRPAQPITRDAIAAFIYRFAGSPKFTVSKSFKDIAGNEHRKAIEWLGSTGISTGWADGTYRPGLFTERGAIAAFLHRYSDKGVPIAVL